MGDSLKVIVFIGDVIRENSLGNFKGESFFRVDGRELGVKKEYKIRCLYENSKFFFISNKEASLLLNDKTVEKIEVNNVSLFKIKLKGIENSLHIIAYEFDSTDFLFKRYHARKGKDISIGKLPENDIQIDLPLCSKLHARLRIGENENSTIYDISSKGGVYKNSIRINNEAQVNPGDVLFIMGLKIIWFGEIILVNSPGNKFNCKLQPDMDDKFPMQALVENIHEKPFFTKAPRVIRYQETGVHDIDPPTPPQVFKPQPLLLRMGPSVTMALAMLASLGVSISNARSGNSAISATSGIMAGSMLLGAVMWPMLSDRYQKKVIEKEEKNRVAQYKAYLKEQEELLNEKVNSIRDVALNMNPEPRKIIERALDGNRKLWERTAHDEDFLEIRIGLGRLKFNIDINIQKDKFNLTTDVLKDEPKKLKGQFERISGMPVKIPLKDDVIIGIMGRESKRYDLANCMAVQLAGLYGYDELKMVFIYNEAQSEHFQWVKNLPHTWSEDRMVRFIASDTDEVREVFSHISEVLSGREQNKKEAGTMRLSIPYYVVFILDKALIEDELACKYLMDSNNGLSISTIFVVKNISSLPSDCQTIVQYDDEICGIYGKKRKDEGQLEFTADSVSKEDIEKFSNAMAVQRLKTITENAYIPKTLDFIGMYKVGNVEQLQVLERWDESMPYKSLAAPIGLKAGGEVFNLNIHEKYHGPHGLVAGMTGSGKSEFIQAYILSMAINYHPHDVSFILIDYKGGGMANCFKGLPHVAGIITNLGGNQIKRSLVSINAELKRRQKFFDAAGVRHIDEYQALYKEYLNNGSGSDINVKIPLPHLIIISDEFAELKQQCREFMDELISAARIGRSLGVHLILATQKPSNVVDDQIWSNTRFRVCLKVFDRGDSNEMLKRPEAASIKLPGRCYVQIGYNEIFEQIQSGYSGAPYIPEDEYVDPDTQKVTLIDNCARNVKSVSIKKVHTDSKINQLTAVVKYIEKLSEEKKIYPLHVWKEPLKQFVSLDDIEEFRTAGFDGLKWIETGKWLEPLIGIADDPANQNQFVLKVNIGEKGHTALVGMPGTGKTTFLQTLVYSTVHLYSPDDVILYIFDFGGRTMGYFNTLPHCMDVAFSDEEDRIENILTELLHIMEERKRDFAVYNVGNIRSYISASGIKIPAVLLIIDNYSILKERYYDFESSIIALAREGANYGIYLVLTGSTTNAISGRVMDYVKQTFTLQLLEKSNYMEIVGPTNGLEPESVKGRGLVKLNVPLEYQTALALNEVDEAERAKKLNEEFIRMKAVWNGDKSKTVQINKSSSSGTDLYTKSREAVINMEAFYDKLSLDLLPIAWNYKEGTVESIDLKASNQFFISGLENMGKTCTLILLAKMIKKMPGWMLYIAEGNSCNLKELSGDLGTEGYFNTEEAFDSFLDRLADEYIKRAKSREVYLGEGGSPDELYLFMSKFEKIFILIDDFDSFYSMISNKALTKLQYMTKYENVNCLNIYFITTGTPEKIIKFNNNPIYSKMLKTKQGLVLGGSVNEHMTVSLDNMNASERALKYKAGHGVFFNSERYSSVAVPPDKD